MQRNFERDEGDSSKRSNVDQSGFMSDSRFSNSNLAFGEGNLNA